MSGELVMSVEVLGRTDTDSGGRAWTIGPCNWTKHLSPMVGRLAGTKEPGKDGKTEKYGYVFKTHHHPDVTDVFSAFKPTRSNYAAQSPLPFTTVM